MPFKIVRNDITKMCVDAIVNTANPEPTVGGGTDGAIYAAAGRERLLAERIRIGKMEAGQAAVTPAFDLQARYIIHTVGPVWKDGNQGEAAALRSCYENSLKLAREYRCESIAFPLISTGVYGFPKDQALQIVISAVSKFLTREDMMIYLVVFDGGAVRLSEKLFEKVEAYIDDAYVTDRERRYSRRRGETSVNVPGEIRFERGEAAPMAAPKPPAKEEKKASFGISLPKLHRPSVRSLKDLLRQPDETFQQMLLRLIAERGMTNAEAYKKANQDKKLFSKIKNDINYQPKKKTAMAFALALELNLDETKDLLARAGYAFSPSSNFDKAIQYFIETKEYNIYEIEIILYDLGLDSLCNYY